MENKKQPKVEIEQSIEKGRNEGIEFLKHASSQQTDEEGVVTVLSLCGIRVPRTDRGNLEKAKQWWEEQSYCILEDICDAEIRLGYSYEEFESKVFQVWRDCGGK
jgi:hypothetical protein